MSFHVDCCRLTLLFLDIGPRFGGPPDSGLHFTNVWASREYYDQNKEVKSGVHVPMGWTSLVCMGNGSNRPRETNVLKYFASVHGCLLCVLVRLSSDFVPKYVRAVLGILALEFCYCSNSVRSGEQRGFQGVELTVGFF